MSTDPVAAMREFRAAWKGSRPVRHKVTPEEAEEARTRLMASYTPCEACGIQQAGPIHRTSARLWTGRAERARPGDGIDPLSGTSLDAAERHLAVIRSAAKALPLTLDA